MIVECVKNPSTINKKQLKMIKLLMMDSINSECKKLHEVEREEETKGQSFHFI